MDVKLTLPAIVQIFSRHTGETRKFSEDFIRELFTLVSSALAEGEQVKIRGFGVFKLIDVEARKSVDVTTGNNTVLPAHKKIVFVPSKETAAAVNEPFEMFETVEVEDKQSDQSTSTPDADNPEVEFADTETAEETDYPEIPEIPETVPKVAETALEEPEKSVGDSPRAQEPYADDDSDTPYSDTPYYESVGEEYCQESHPKPKRFVKGFVFGFCASLLLIAVLISAFLYFDSGCWDRIHAFADNLKGKTNVTLCIGTEKSGTVNTNAETKSGISESAVTADRTESESTTSEKPHPDAESGEVPTAPSDEIIYDTISKTRYLTTMAKQHYGNYNLWPYIYMENQSFLGHPDRIKPGTKVVIPPLSKYGINPDNQEDIKKAKLKGQQIYAKYQ